jgi:hypothetical protein
MEPRREKPKVPKPQTEEKAKRFRLIKLEKRIAPTSFQWGMGSQSTLAK